MSHQQTQAVPQKQANSSVVPQKAAAPIPLSPEQLKQIAGGVSPCIPNVGW